MQKVVIWTTVFGLLGLVLCIVGSTLFALFPNIMKNKLTKLLVLHNDTEIFDKWKDVPVPVYTKFYVFNVKNPKAIMNGDPPELEEIGPFVFKQEVTKEIEGYSESGSFDEENNQTRPSETLRVRYVKTYYFEPSMSTNFSLDEKVNVINIPLMYAAKTIVHDIPPTVKENVQKVWEKLSGNEEMAEKLSLLKLMISQWSITDTVPVKEILFEGYKPNLFEFLKALPELIPPIPGMEAQMSTFKQLLGGIIQKLPERFGLFYGKNGNDDGLHEIFTGDNDYERFTQIYAFNNKSSLSFWAGDDCNKINGTDGRQFPPYISKDDRLYAFITDLCRSIYLEFEKEVTVHSIPAYKFRVPKHLLESPEKNPDNQCFVRDPSMQNLDGVLDISSCKDGVPITMSLPHFYMGSDELRANFSGLQPDRDLHETEIILDPMTGTVLKASRKIQVNVKVTKLDFLPAVKNVFKPDIIFPVLWLDEGGEIDEKNAGILYDKVRRPVILANALLITAIVLGCVLFVGALTIRICKRSKYAKTGKF